MSLATKRRRRVDRLVVNACSREGARGVSWDDDGEEEVRMSWAAVCCDALWLWLWPLWQNVPDIGASGMSASGKYISKSENDAGIGGIGVGVVPIFEGTNNGRCISEPSESEWNHR